MGNSNVIYCRSRKSRAGFVLLDVVFAFCILALLSVICSTASSRFMYYWQYQKQEIELQDAGRYMLNHLEKELGLNSHKVIINANGIIKYQTIYGNKQIELYRNNGGLYKKTINAYSSGVNPLFLEKNTLVHWKVSIPKEKEILVQFTLKNGQRRKDFCGLIYCNNAVQCRYE